MKVRNAEILMAVVVVARSTSFIMSKTGLGSIEPLNLLGVRFLLAFVIMALLFGRRFMHISGREARSGFIIGAIYFAVMAAEMFGLKYTDSSRVAFLENSAIVYVPFIEAVIIHSAPRAKTILCTLTALAGVALLTLNGGLAGFGRGEAYSILAALLYAAAIVATARLSQEGDPLLVGIVQVGTMGALSMAGSFLFESPRLPNTGTEWAIIIMLALICTCIGFTLQPMAQKYISAERASVITALNPVSAAVFGAVFLHESLGISGIIGGILVMCGIMIQTVEKKNVKEIDKVQGRKSWT